MHGRASLLLCTNLQFDVLVPLLQRFSVQQQGFAPANIISDNVYYSAIKFLKLDIKERQTESLAFF